MAVSRVIKVDDVHRICYREKVQIHAYIQVQSHYSVYHKKEVNNIYGMFRTRSSLHQKAYQHKSVIAAERM